MTDSEGSGESMALRVLGLDEAGRGSVLGPLVVGGFLTSTTNATALTENGIRDSKLLSPNRREIAYRRLPSLGTRYSIALSPRLVDRYVARGRLNELEARAFAAIVRRSKAVHVVADACDPREDRFARTIERFARRPVHVDARHHADRDVPVVGAASIVAKVRRDRAIQRIERSVGRHIGSGYPSDPATVEWVRRTLREEGAPSPFVRYSWRTTERLKPKPAARTLDAFA